MAIEPAESPIMSGGCKGPHKIQGVGPGFIPATTDVSVADEIVMVSSEKALMFASKLVKEEGLLVGISFGAAFAVSLKVAKRPENIDNLIVVLLPSGGMRYLTSDLYVSVREECNNMTF